MADGRNDQRVTIEALMDEQRLFRSSKEFNAKAKIDSPAVNFQGEDYEKFWLPECVDNTLNVSRHAVSTLEVPSTLACRQHVAGSPPARSHHRHQTFTDQLPRFRSSEALTTPPNNPSEQPTLGEVTRRANADVLKYVTARAEASTSP